MAERPTRGHGLLEGFLARRRAAMARSLLPSAIRSGTLLDLGCGTTPLFLRQVDARERVGIDRTAREGVTDDGIRILRRDLAAEPALPFQDGGFDAVTMLAVFEHIPPAALTPLLAETRRVLRPGGRLILTTPAGWTAPLLTALSLLRLVSHEEIDEHQDAYDHAAIRDYLLRAGFDAGHIALGSFELGMNLWATAER